MRYSTYPVKWSIISAGTIGFWSQCIILLGYHFTGARSYILLVYHFTETSFYWNNFVKFSVSFLSVSFYDSTFKNFNTNRYIFCCIGTMLQYYKCNSQRFLVNRQRNTYLLLGDNRLQYCLHFFTSISRIRTGNCFWDSVNTVPSDGNANPHLGLSRFKKYLYFLASLVNLIST